MPSKQSHLGQGSHVSPTFFAFDITLVLCPANIRQAEDRRRSLALTSKSPHPAWFTHPLAVKLQPLTTIGVVLTPVATQLDLMVLACLLSFANFQPGRTPHLVRPRSTGLEWIYHDLTERADEPITWAMIVVCTEQMTDVKQRRDEAYRRRI